MNTQSQPVVGIPTLFLKLKSVRITTLLGGLPAILIRRKETTTVKRQTGFPLYCVMIWSVLLSKKNDRVWKIRVLARYYCVDFFPLLQSSQVKVPPKIPSMSLLFESWVCCLGSCKFQIRLFIPACVTRYLWNFYPLSFERKPKTDLHRPSLLWLRQNLHIFALMSMSSRYFNLFSWATRGARNPNLQFVIMQESHVCNQHSFGLLLKICM